MTLESLALRTMHGNHGSIPLAQKKISELEANHFHNDRSEIPKECSDIPKEFNEIPKEFHEIKKVPGDRSERVPKLICTSFYQFCEALGPP